MGLFDKKYCDICGEKIGLLGNRKLEDGNLCKNCSKKLSPFFSDRKKSTVEEIKSQLAYREANQRALENFRPTRKIGNYWMVMIDETKRQFVVTQSNDLMKDNPDIINISGVLSCNSNVTDYRTEVKYRNNKGEQTSYNPPRYEYRYDFYIEIGVDHPYFSNIKIKLNSRSVEVITEMPQRGLGFFNNTMNGVYPEYNPEYRGYKCMADEIITALMLKTEYNHSDSYSATGQTLPEQTEHISFEQKPSIGESTKFNDDWICTFCQTSNNGGKFCQNCGAEKPYKTKDLCICSNCGWQSDSNQNVSKFCPECGNPLA